MIERGADRSHVEDDEDGELFGAGTPQRQFRPIFHIWTFNEVSRPKFWY